MKRRLFAVIAGIFLLVSANAAAAAPFTRDVVPGERIVRKIVRFLGSVFGGGRTTTHDDMSSPPKP